MIKLKCFANEDEGYVLPYVLMISLLVVTLLFSLISVIYFNNIKQTKQINKKKLEILCYSELNRFLSFGKKIPADTVYHYNLEGTEILTEVKQTGLFIEAVITATGKNNKVKVSYLLGSSLNESFKNALTITRPNLSGSYAGGTKIFGDIVSTARYFEKANLFGLPPGEKDYIEGWVKLNKNLEIKLFTDTLIYLMHEKTAPNNALVIDENTEILIDTLYKAGYSNIKINGSLLLKSFEKQRKRKNNFCIFVSGVVTIDSEIDCNGLEIYTDGKVIFNEGAKVSNLLVYSKDDIVIENKSILEGAQLFTEKNIYVNNSVMLYPSVVSIIVDPGIEDNLDNILSLKNSKVNGNLILFSKTAGLQQNKSKIFLDKESSVNGIVYSENNCESHGYVTGSIYAYNIIYNKDEEVFFNLLVNLKINRRSFDGDNFLLPVILKDNKYRIIKETWYN